MTRMDEIPRFDVPFLFRQCAVIAGLTFVPPFVVAWILPRRRFLVPLVLICFAVVSVLLFYLSYRELDAFHRDPLPYRPFRVGPSWFGVWDIFKALALTLWLPTVALYGLTGWFLARKDRRLYGPPALAAFLAYAIIGTGCTGFWLTVGEWMHEDTFSSSGFSWVGWERVRVGMSRSEVVAVLGPPLSNGFKPAFAQQQGAECWVSNLTAGYFAAVWFHNDTVSDKQFFYSD